MSALADGDVQLDSVGTEHFQRGGQRELSDVVRRGASANHHAISHRLNIKPMNAATRPLVDPSFDLIVVCLCHVGILQHRHWSSMATTPHHGGLSLDSLMHAMRPRARVQFGITATTVPLGIDEPAYLHFVPLLLVRSRSSV